MEKILFQNRLKMHGPYCTPDLPAVSLSPKLRDPTTKSLFYFCFLSGDDPSLALLESSPGKKKPQQQLSNAAEVTTGGGGNGLPERGVSAISKVGHSNKSKVMHDLFGLEDSPLKTIPQKQKECSDDHINNMPANSLR